MASIINTNISSLNAQRQLSGSQKMERNAWIGRLLIHHSAAKTKCFLQAYRSKEDECLYKVTQATQVAGPYPTYSSAALAIESITDTWTPTRLDAVNGRIPAVKNRKLRYYVTSGMAHMVLMVLAH
ncbi:MAG: hypothetical protein EOO29_21150, partial [Comamonadaceae bacterium]